MLPESEVIEPAAGQVHGPGELSIEEVVMMMAFWALQHGAGYVTGVARSMGMADADLARALRLAERGPGVRQGRRPAGPPRGGGTGPRLARRRPPRQ